MKAGKFTSAITAVSVAITTTLSGCASSPDKVEAAYVPSSRYVSASCDQIAEEMIEVGTKAAQLSGQLDSAAGKDAALVAVGIVLFWPALFFVGSDKGKEAELARLKGERDALVKAAKQKGCKLDDARPAVQRAVEVAPAPVDLATPTTSITKQ